MSPWNRQLPLPFPPILWESIQAATSLTKAPYATVVCAFLASAAATCQHLFVVKRPTGQVSPPTLFLMDIAASGERKSAVHDVAMRYLREFQSEERIRTAPLKEAYQYDLEDWKRAQREIRRQRRKVETGQQSPGNSPELELPPKPEFPKFLNLLLEDSTLPAFYKVLDEYIPSVLISTAEGGIALKSQLFHDPVVLNSAWSGETLRSARAIRGEIVIEKPKASIHISVQPLVFEAYVKPRGKLLQGNGFLGRCLIAESMGTRGFRMITGTPVSDEPIKTFYGRQSEILAAPYDPETAPYVMEFEPLAGTLLTNYYHETEKDQRLGEKFFEIPEAASKTAEQAGRLAGVFQFMEHGPSKISYENAQRGIEVAHWFLLEHLRLLGPQPTIPQEELDAATLLQWLRERQHHYGLISIPCNDILKFGPNGVRSPRRHRRDAALRLLELEGYITIQTFNGTHHVVQTWRAGRPLGMHRPPEGPTPPPGSWVL